MAGKRGRGEGTIRKRVWASGRVSWEARISYWDKGRRRQRSVYSPTRAEAAAQLQRELQRIGQGEEPPNPRITMGDYLASWLEDKRTDVRLATWLTYKGYVEHHLVPALDRTRLAQLRPEQVNAFLTGRLRAGLAPRTVVHIRAILRTALNDARRRGLVDRNVAALARSPKVVEIRPSPMTPEEARQVLAAVAGSDVEAIVAVALLAGLRLGEVLGLAWRDVDLGAQTLRVRQALQRRAGETRLVPPKSSESRRVVPMTRSLGVAMAAHRQREEGKRALLGLEPLSPDHLAFSNRFGEPVDPSWVSHAFAARLEAAALPRRRFHDLRHACATLLLATGEVDLKVVSAILGHSSIRLTADTYAGVVDRLGERAATSLERLLGGDLTAEAPRA